MTNSQNLKKYSFYDKKQLDNVRKAHLLKYMVYKLVYEFLS